MQYLLAFFFLLMYAGDQLGINVGLGPGMSVKNLLLYILITGIAINAAVARNREFELPSIWVLFGLLILYAVMTWTFVSFVIASPDYDMRESAIQLKSSLVDMFLTFFVFFYGVMQAKDAFWLLRAIAWIAIIGNIVTIVDAFNIPNLGLVEARLRDARFEGFIGQANEYGSFLVLFLPLSVAIYLGASGRVRALAAIGAFSTALALVLTGSRGAYAGLLAGGGLAAFYLRGVISTQLMVRAGFAATFVGAVVLMVAIVAGYSDLFLDRFARFSGSSHEVTSGRSTIWAAALAAMVENPWTFLTGFGFSAYDSSRSFYAAMHNMYLNYLFDLGAIGLFLYIGIFGRVLATARSTIAIASAETKPYFIALVFGLLPFLVTLLFGGYHSGGYLLWAYLGVAMRLAMQVRSDSNAEPVESATAGETFAVPSSPSLS